MKPFQSRTFQSIIILGFVLLVCCVVPAQVPNPQPQSPAPTIQPSATPPVQAVKLNVLVTDEADRFVGTLRQEDFRIEEDGAAQTITQFARERSPVSYAIVVDNSGSLRDLMGYIVRTAGSLVQANQPGDETMIVRFVSSDNISVMQDFTANQAALMKGLGAMYVEGGQTAVIDAVYISAARVAEHRAGESGRRRALVLLTDGEDRSSYYKLTELQTLLRQTGVQVFAIGWLQNLDEQEGFIRKSTRGQATKLLDSLTQETGGRVFYPKNLQALIAAVAEISNYLRTQYIIGYQTTNASRDGKFRKVRVKLNESTSGAKHRVHARSGYFAPDAKGGVKTQSKEKSPRLRTQ